ncbi:Outer membrane biogenesis protein BamB [Candidatus Sulfopaludibacter sp. SbA4]|nr:Outer membrane biogenesis protein BamB [Candidatus Sulfopaludibacter sp. SbA4]
MKRWCPALLAAVCAFAADVTTYHNDNARTGQNANETILTPSNVSVNTFGKLFVITTDGRVDAQPLYLSAVNFPAQGTHNALYVATEHDSVYAFDADTGTQLWKASMLKSGETSSDDRGCGQVSPEIGVTSTPVIDRSIGPHGTIYVVAMSKDTSGNYHQRLHALDLTTGAEEFSGPQEVQATYPGLGDNSNGTSVVFDPKQYKDRAALLLLNGVVYTSWASHCDDAPYTGWVIGYNENTLAQTSVFDFTPNGNEGSVWMAGAGPAADAKGYIYFLAANGTFDTALTNGFPSQGDYGNAFLKLSVQNTSSVLTNLAVADYFTMANTVNESNGDVDFGSGGALVLPDMTDSHGVTRHLAVGAGKDQHIYLVDRDNMGKFNPSTDSNYQDLVGALPGGEWAMPAYFNGHLYYGGVNDVIKGYQFSNATLVTPPAWTSTTSYGYPGATPSISASSSTATNPIIWAVENTGTATLHAYGMDLNELYNSNQAASGRDHFGGGNKFITPTIANGKVYVGTPTGVGVLGILPANPAPVITSSLKASGTVGRSFSYQITASHNPTSYSATGPPAGLSVNTKTGKISGTPQSAGTTTVTIGATNGTGTGTAKLVITIRKH